MTTVGERRTLLTKDDVMSSSRESWSLSKRVQRIYYGGTVRTLRRGEEGKNGNEVRGEGNRVRDGTKTTDGEWRCLY